MKLYQRLALECEIEKNSHVQVPDEALHFFTRLVIMGESFAEGNNNLTSGTFHMNEHFGVNVEYAPKERNIIKP